MSQRVRGDAAWKAVLPLWMVLLCLCGLGSAFAAEKPAVAKPEPRPAADKALDLTSDRAKVSYMIGADVGRSISSSGPDMDFAAFERAVRNAFDGGQPLLSDAESKTVGTALMQRIAAVSYTHLDVYKRQLQGGGLAGAVRADQADDAAGADLEVGAVERDLVLVGLAQAAGGNLSLIHI